LIMKAATPSRRTNQNRQAPDTALMRLLLCPMIRSNHARSSFVESTRSIPASQERQRFPRPCSRSSRIVDILDEALRIAEEIDFEEDDEDEQG
jgi:hypothetical protein